MADQPASPSGSQTPGPAPEAGTDFHIGEEFGTAKRNLPPAGILLICIVGVAVILGVAAFLQRQKPLGAGSIDFISAAEVPDQNLVLASITLSLRNGENKPLWIHSLKARLTTSDDKALDDEAASGVELDRYAQAFPILKEHARAALLPETKIMPDKEQQGTIVVSFPVTKQAFDQRKSLAVTIWFYDHPVPLVLTK